MRSKRATTQLAVLIALLYSALLIISSVMHLPGSGPAIVFAADDSRSERQSFQLAQAATQTEQNAAKAAQSESNADQKSKQKPDAKSDAANAEPIKVSIHVDAAKSLGKLRPIWRFFGADEPNYAYMNDGKKLIGELGALDPKHVYFRAHNLLCTGDGTPSLKWGSTNAYTEDAEGKPIYDWTILDRIFDTYLADGVRPYAQIGFIPEAMSTKPDSVPYQHQWGVGKNSNLYTGWAYPPKDFQKWNELVYQWTKHCVERYGKDEVEHWYWEVWNEANIGYWKGTAEQFYELQDFAIAGVRKALPTARVGGPDKAGGGGDRWMHDFLEHCVRGKNYATGEIGTPLDFISYHAKGSPSLSEGHVRMGISNHLQGIDSGFRMVASFPELKDKPIVIGESDPDSCAACQGGQYGYRNTTMFSSYTANCLARELELTELRGVNLEGALTWAFEFEGKPLFNGYRKLAAGGIDMPVMNVFRMYSKMGGNRIATESDAGLPLETVLRSGVRDQPDISALASVDDSKLCVLVWYYHDDDLPGPVAEINLAIAGLPKALVDESKSADLALEHFRIDADHSNAYNVWQKMGSPQTPTDEQLAQLEKAGQLATVETPAVAHVTEGKAQIHITLPRQGVSLLVFKRPAK